MISYLFYAIIYVMDFMLVEYSTGKQQKWKNILQIWEMFTP